MMPGAPPVVAAPFRASSYIDYFADATRVASMMMGPPWHLMMCSYKTI
jgi:hypothetical protein